MFRFEGSEDDERGAATSAAASNQPLIAAPTANTPGDQLSVTTVECEWTLIYVSFSHCNFSHLVSPIATRF